MKKIIICTDGGSRGNPGPAAFGAIICDESGKILKEYGETIGIRTNNEAEYEAVVFALKKVKALYGKDALKNSEVEVRADSELLVKQMNGEYKIMEPKIQELFLKVWNLKTEFKNLKFTAVRREKNQDADRLVNEALDRKSSTQTLF